MFQTDTTVHDVFAVLRWNFTLPYDRSLRQLRETGLDDLQVALVAQPPLRQQHRRSRQNGENIKIKILRPWEKNKGEDTKKDIIM